MCEVELKRKVGRPVNPNKQVRTRDDINAYYKEYNQKKYNIYRKIMYLNNTYSIPENIKTLPQSTPEDATNKLTLMIKFVSTVKLPRQKKLKQ
jgi:hypothetical protein